MNLINILLGKIRTPFLFFKIRWNKENKHNFTTIARRFPIEKVSVGNYTYGKLIIRSYGNEKEKLKIGSFCSIASDVEFLLGGEHEWMGLSTYPFRKCILKEEIKARTKGEIIVGDDVWLGARSTVLSGVSIGQGALIAAGSIVYKDIPPYAIYGGGKIIKYRFPQEIISLLMEIDFSIIDMQFIRENIEILTNEIDSVNQVHEILKNLKEYKR